MGPLTTDGGGAHCNWRTHERTEIAGIGLLYPLDQTHRFRSSTGVGSACKSPVDKEVDGMRSGKRTGFLAATVALCAASAVLPGVASAGTLDQQQTAGSPGAGYIIDSAQSVAQTFTAGITGRLDQADLLLFQGGDASLPLTIEIRYASITAPGDTVVASTSIPAASVATSGAFVSVTFPSPGPVTAGTQYAIVAYSSSHYAWEYSDSNPYPAGDFAYSASSPPSNAWTASSNFDLAFRTYVGAPAAAPGPAPAAGSKKKCKKKHRSGAVIAKKCKKKRP